MKITPLHASAPCRALKGCRPCFTTKRPRSPLSRAFPARLTVWAVYLSGDDRGKRARQRGRDKSGLYQFVLFPSPRWKQPQNPSPTFARKPRAIVQKCTGQKAFVQRCGGFNARRDHFSRFLVKATSEAFVQ